MGYTKDTIVGLSWMGLLRASMRIITFIKIAVLARLLLPDQYGLFGIASLVLAFLEIITETGINVFFVQREGEVKEYLNTAWVVSIFRGILITILMLILSPFIALFFKSPESLGILRLISIVPFIRGFINPAIIVFRKELHFNKEFLFKFLTFSFDGIVAIIVAFITRSPISLVIGMLAGTTLEIILSFIWVKPTPKFELEIDKTIKVVSRGKWITAAGIFNYLFHQGDDIVVGRLMDTSALGLYQMIYKISTLPITEIAEVFGSVTFPIYSRINTDKKRLQIAFYKVTGLITLITIPLGLVLYFFPREVILVLLGPNWIKGAEVLKILSVFGVLRAISGSSSALFLAIKKQEYVMVVTLVSIGGLALSIVPLTLKYGLIGASISPLIGSLMAIPVIFYYLYKTLS